MKLKIDYLENEIELGLDYVNSIEIENKVYFYRTIQNFNKISIGQLVEEINFFDSNVSEINCSGKLLLLIDYFNFDIIFKKYLNSLLKIIENNISEEEKNELSKIYKKIEKIINRNLDNLDFSFIINGEFEITQMIKMMKFSLETKESILENLFLVIDIEKVLNINKVLFFINLKQYLSNEELIEFYKYSIYNGIKIVLIDSQCYGATLNYEKKVIIDANLEEFVL